MIPVTFKIGSKTVRCTVPSAWNELTVAQYVALESELNDFELLQILTGQPLEEIENTSTDLTPILVKVAKWLNEGAPDFMNAPISPIRVFDKVVEPPKESFKMTKFGQMLMLKQLATMDNLKKAIPTAVAIYAQPLVDGEFKSDRVPAVRSEIEKGPAVVFVPWASFFLRKLINLKASLEIDSTRSL